jgi:thioester reductase-like protein
LTGATGFLGRYLLRELLAAGRPVLVLARDLPGHSAQERVDEITAFACETHGRSLPRPVVLCGDLALPDVGLDSIDRRLVAQRCRAIVHAAACVALRHADNGEPWKTNVGGTQRLLEFCESAGIGEFHHVSTAFVCGNRPGPAREDGPSSQPGFHNDYERSKWEAERRVRSGERLRATIYRPSVIVGDSLTGHTSSYHAFYRFLELGDRLAQPVGAARRTLALRLPFRGDEPRNLVPVDWVARAIATVVQRPSWHGRTYHLTSPEPVLARSIKEIAEELLGIDGVMLAGAQKPADPSPIEETFFEHLDEYWPYADGDPLFDRRNTEDALPDLPCPTIDRAFLTRLIRFGVADRWGRASRNRVKRRGRLDCASYVERFFPEAVARSSLAKLPIDVNFGLDVHDGGQWQVRLRAGQPVEVRRGSVAGAAIVYRTDGATFDAIVRGRLTPQEAFFERRIQISGDVERALKLAVLFGQFVVECPYRSSPVPEQRDVVGVPA